MILSIDAEKLFNKINICSWYNSRKNRNKDDFLNLLKNICKNQ